jgi:uncharacterized protein YjiS (DUF1127 family)
MSICTDHSMTNHHGESFAARLSETIQGWRQRRHDRAELARMSQRDLHDAGISWSEVAYEIDKPFWRA